VASLAFSQGPPPDTVLHLKSGTEVRGKLLEIKDGAYVLTLPDERTILYPTSDVDIAERISERQEKQVVQDKDLLEPGHRVYVQPVVGSGKHEYMKDFLRSWGRWEVVNKQEDAEIMVQLDFSGSDLMGMASIIATIKAVATGAELWKSEKHTGLRTIFHLYASPYKRASEGVVEEMKKAFTTKIKKDIDDKNFTN
jgi:hypothetical protein